MATFPGSIKTFTTLVDGADSVLAAHQNQRGDEITAIETWILSGLGSGTSTISDVIKDLLIQGYMVNGYISASVASNDLTVAIKTLAGADPSASDPVYVRIGNTVRSITAALSVTKNDGTNWCNAGGAELATKEIDYFVYLGYNATDGVVIGFSRFPGARVYSDFSVTSTNEKYAGISTITNAAATDEYEVIGRFNATLSAGAGYTWSIPATPVVVSRPIYETRWLTWVPVVQAGNPTYGTVTYPLARYKLIGTKCEYQFGTSGTGAGTAGTNISFTLPFESAQSALTDPPVLGPAWTSDGNVSCQAFITAGTPDLIKFFKYNIGNFTNSGTYTIRSTGFYEV